jgi:anti-sigma B factor antagonist
MEDRVTEVINPADLRLSRSTTRIVARLSGEIDVSNAALVKRTITESVSNEAMQLVVDMSQVRYVDSAGIAMLLDLSRRLGDHHQRMVVVVPSSSLILRSLKAAGWPATIPIVASLDETLERPAS